MKSIIKTVLFISGSLVACGSSKTTAVMEIAAREDNAGREIAASAREALELALQAPVDFLGPTAAVVRRGHLVGGAGQRPRPTPWQAAVAEEEGRSPRPMRALY